ncbi:MULTISPECIES: hypothetical protein [Acinetobacter]|uniref:Uncharacterized protein n=1 Tax=Acinetobacter pollinis TaxID=2605270 RepID=A0ABU6DV12_9GAMM|nr:MULTISPECIES: hypothetical protein [Acinetobacter]MBF7691538.1 hypothetical protein [Acinetobacter pollinis]MBF7693727.1 hypothetical protein [Acinetobacter pollinis]MBF7698797.1 hypothetical protein [Acinetobacter pollinis]MBF7701246.1 hypothetical protein [Acinetobacter pollinis]MEB5477699.1 hypothetical protein [Acinetobacter pollinis]
MKQLFTASLLLISSTIVFATTQPKATPNVTADDITIVPRPVIYGLWGIELPNNKKCMEFYNFKTGNRLVINSASEWATGVYDYQPSPDNNVKVGALAIQMKFDNNQPDCSGQRTEVNTDVAQYYVHWKDQNNLQFCTSADGNQCFVNLKRILP